MSERSLIPIEEIEALASQITNELCTAEHVRGAASMLWNLNDVFSDRNLCRSVFCKIRIGREGNARCVNIYRFDHQKFGLQEHILSGDRH